MRKAQRDTGRRSVLALLIERRSFRAPFKRTLTADVAANLIRNVWSYAIIFCGHFPDQTYTPSTRYGEIAPRVREICERYDRPYNSGPFHQQLGMVQRTILRLALPGGRARPKPGRIADRCIAARARSRRRTCRTPPSPAARGARGGCPTGHR
jgi:linoleoyl-CoA desaturase